MFNIIINIIQFTKFNYQLNNSPLTLLHLLRVKMAFFEVFWIDFSVSINIIPRRHQLRN